MLLSDPAHPSVPHCAPLPLDRLVTAVDTTLGGRPDVVEGGVLLRVTGHPPQVATIPLEGDHPLDMLLGFTAPVHWRAIGIHCRARAYDLPGPDRGEGGRAVPDGPDGPEPPHPVVVTVLVDRSGSGSGLLRRGPLSTRLPGAPEGSVGDACRRALGLATPAPPSSTAELWLRVWLDRVVEAAGSGDDRDELTTWDAVAALHPASPARPTPAAAQPPTLPAGVGLGDPEALAETTHVLAGAWPWSRLRHEPDVIDTARPPLPRQVAEWMDDGMFARWVLAELADLGLLCRTVRALLPPGVAAAVDDTVQACGLHGWWGTPGGGR